MRQSHAVESAFLFFIWRFISVCIQYRSPILLPSRLWNPTLTTDKLQRTLLERTSLPDAGGWAGGINFNWPALQAVSDKQTPLADRVEQLRLRAAFTNQRPASARLLFSYTRVPPLARQILARGIGWAQRRRQSSWAKFPEWPVDLSVDALADASSVPTIKFDIAPVLVSHDIDSPSGLQNLVRHFLPIEEAIGCRSVNYIVPCAWPIDDGLVEETRRRGHEIGVHGFDHSNLTPYAAPEERTRRLSAGREFADRYAGVGYRAPSLLRTRELIDDLQQFYRYDSSIPTSGGPFPVPNNGCASARPWKFGPMWELPLTLPRDGSLRYLGYSPNQILEMWQSSAVYIAGSGGLVSLLTHCEAGFSGNPPMLAVYRAFLEWCAANPRLRFTRPCDLVDELDQRTDAYV
jgi:peptidoglycan/xylan/chitin deacetylase (PgdA/CDA1 family)